MGPPGGAWNFPWASHKAPLWATRGGFNDAPMGPPEGPTMGTPRGPHGPPAGAPVVATWEAPGGFPCMRSASGPPRGF